MWTGMVVAVPSPLRGMSHWPPHICHPSPVGHCPLGLFPALSIHPNLCLLGHILGFAREIGLGQCPVLNFPPLCLFLCCRVYT